MSSSEAVDARRIGELKVKSTDTGTSETERRPRPLRDSVVEALDDYFRQLDGQPVTDLYDLVIAEIEAPLFASVLKETRNNQTRCASMLGMNRGTLRKKLKKYNLI